MFFDNRCYEKDYSAMNGSMSMGAGGCGCTCEPVMECPQERVCHREMNYEVPHIIPINTRIVNHHVYRHTYQPMYTCTTEDTVSNVYDNKCGF